MRASQESITSPWEDHFLWGPMEKVNIHSVYDFANTIHPLTSWGRRKVTIGDIRFPLTKARTAINGLLNAGIPVTVRTSAQAAGRLKKELDALHDEFFEDVGFGLFVPKGTSTDVIEDWKLYGVQLEAADFEVVFRAEMEGAPVYSVAKSGNYDVSDLVDSFDSGLPSSLRHVFGEKALKEFRAAGRCYAFALPSASAFHACRAVEAVLLKYYEVFCGEIPGHETWGKLLDRLRKCSGPNLPNARTLGHLDLMRENDRNPIMHPRIELNDADADALLGLAKTAMIFMAQEMAPHIKPEPPTIEFAE